MKEITSIVLEGVCLFFSKPQAETALDIIQVELFPC